MYKNNIYASLFVFSYLFRHKIKFFEKEKYIKEVKAYKSKGGQVQGKKAWT